VSQGPKWKDGGWVAMQMGNGAFRFISEQCTGDGKRRKKRVAMVFWRKTVNCVPQPFPNHASKASLPGRAKGDLTVRERNNATVNANQSQPQDKRKGPF
jgi:hypothetical protein